MNEKIKSLLTPHLKTWGGASGDNFSEELELFAKLIVKECVSIVENSRIEGDAGVCWVDATKCKIEQHFGVQE